MATSKRKTAAKKPAPKKTAAKKASKAPAKKAAAPRKSAKPARRPKAGKPAPRPVAKTASKPSAKALATKAAPKVVSKPAPKPLPKAVPKPAPKAVPKPAAKAIPKPAMNAAPKPAPKPAVKAAPAPAAKAAAPLARSAPAKTAPARPTEKGAVILTTRLPPAQRGPLAPPSKSQEQAHEAFMALRALLMRHAARLRLVADRPGHITFEAGFAPEWNKILFFGAAAMQKSYVSFYLFPVYVFPELLDGVSPQLKARMQGQSCFNFDRPDPKLFEELGALTEKGFERFGRAGWLR